MQQPNHTASSKRSRKRSRENQWLRFGVLALLIFNSGNRAVAQRAPQPAAPTIRNVLFIISDDLKASVLGCYGDKVCKTPNIDKLARQSMVFDRTYCQGTACRPSRLSLMFSRYQDARTKGQHVNLGQHFKNNGWYSARVGKIYHMRVPGDIIAGTDGDDVASSWTERFNMQGKEAHTPGDYACLNLNIFTKELENRQSTRMPHRMFVSVKYEGDGSDQPDHKAATKTIALLNKHKDQPFFLATGLVRPHYPMVAPVQYFKPYRWQVMTLPEAVKNDLDDIPRLGIPGTISSRNPIGQYPDNQKRMWAAYYASTTFMDEQVGRIINELDRLDLRKNTAIVFTSDHGYHLGEHTFWQKSNLHDEVLRVPLMIAAPGMKPGRSQSITELLDVYPTLSELAGLPLPDSVQGKSLVPILKDEKANVKMHALSFNRGHCLRSDRWAYMRYTDKTQELYDMKNDPKQFTNLAKSKAHAAVVKQMQLALDAKLAEIKEVK